MEKQYRWLFLGGGILSIIAGIYMFSRPFVGLASMAIFLSIVILISGIAEVVQFFGGNKSGWLLCSGIISILLGLSLMFSSPFQLVAFIPYMIACWILIASFTRFLLSFSVRKVSGSYANQLLIIGIIGIITGIILLCNPIAAAIGVIFVAGFSFIYRGISDIVLFFKLGKEA